MTFAAVFLLLLAQGAEPANKPQDGTGEDLLVQCGKFGGARKGVATGIQRSREPRRFL